MKYNSTKRIADLEAELTSIRNESLHSAHSNNIHPAEEARYQKLYRDEVRNEYYGDSTPA